ncbi:MAG: hypothetical protein AAF600_20970 [Bacteroidota bacterium]
MAYIYFNIGADFLMNDVYDSAIKYLHLAKYLNDSINIERMKVPLIQNLSYAYINSDYIAEAKPLIEEFIAIGEERRNNEILARAYSHMSIFQRATNHPMEAIKYAQKGLQIETGELNIRLSLYLHLSEAYEDAGWYKESLELWKKYDAIDDSLYNIESTGTIAEIEAKYQNEKKEKEIAIQNSKIDLLEKDNKLKRFGPIYCYSGSYY